MNFPLTSISEHLKQQAARLAALGAEAHQPEPTQQGRQLQAVEQIDNFLAHAKSGSSSSANLPVSKILATINTDEGRERLQAYLDSRPFPRFEADPLEADVFYRVFGDGTRTRGRFVGRDFVTEE